VGLWHIVGTRPTSDEVPTFSGRMDESQNLEKVGGESKKSGGKVVGFVLSAENWFSNKKNL